MKDDLIGESFQISTYKFNKDVLVKLEDNLWVKNLWPLIYILSDDSLKEAYVGESTNAISRLNNHLQNGQRNKLRDLYIITSDKFNKSATLDIEANLISYFSGDGKFKLQNGNAGIANHNYYQKDQYFNLFSRIWTDLRSRDVTVKSLKEIDNSDLFKYSPYKSLSNDQYNSVKEILEVLVSGSHKSVIISGSAGTGKTVLAIFLIKLLVTDLGNLFEADEMDDHDEINLLASLKTKFNNPKVGLVISMTSLRNTLKNVFKKIHGLNPKMVIGPTQLAREKYDILFVDEAHRLKRRKNLTGYAAFDNANKNLGFDENGTELDWVMKQSDYQILFYDAEQSIRPTDIEKENFDALVYHSKQIELKSQFRVKGGTDYINYIDKLLNVQLGDDTAIFKNEDYEFIMFETIEPMIDKLSKKEDEYGLARLMAGYAWEWQSKNNNADFDIEIEGVKLKWNSQYQEWINSPDARHEVGCIHTTQGYDLNYAGVIFGHEISYDPEKKEIFIRPENYHDRKGKIGIADESVLLSYVINIYKTLLYRGIRGTYIYVCDKYLREYFKKHIENSHNDNNLEVFSLDEINPFIDAVPYYDIQIAAGEFSEPQINEFMQWIKLKEPYKPSEDYFICKIKGESMNKVIPNNSLCLFKKDSGGTRDGKIVLVQHQNIQDSDFGSGYTIKEYHSEKSYGDDRWNHKQIILQPKSYDQEFSEIVLKDEELTELQILGVFVCVLN